MNTREKKYISKLIDRYDKSNKNLPFYSLVGEPFVKEDLIAGIETLIRGKITMAEITKKFEHNWLSCKFIWSRGRNR